jgi:DMSO/TMAO reductase YedYZ heme-binding membrane subunit
MTTPMTTRAIWIGLVLICCAPLIVWMASVNDPMSYFRLHGLPPGQQLYLIAKLAGLFAFFLFWLQCLLALARYAPMVPGFPVSDLRLHKRLGGATALLILSHVVCFVIAASLRTGHVSWELLLPSFTHGYYKLYVGLGAIAFWIVCLTIFAGWRSARGQHRWKRVHRLWPVVFALVFLHAFAIGTESRFGAMRYLVLFVVASLAIAGIIRFLRSRRHPSSTPPRWHPESGVAR